MIAISIARSIPLFTLSCDNVNDSVNGTVVPVADLTLLCMWMSQQRIQLLIRIADAPGNIQSIGIVGEGFRKTAIRWI
jgi:hypothetical protein